MCPERSSASCRVIWRSDNSIRVEAISKRDGAMLVEETYNL
jgi:hypothetical protein